LQCLLLALMAMTPLPDNISGVAHAAYDGMRAGGDGSARFLPIAQLAYVFQIVVLAQICCMLALGVKPTRRSPFFWAMHDSMLWPVCVCLDGTDLILRKLSSYWSIMVAGFPAATAWLVYAIWLAGLGLVALYVFGFKSYGG
jgi:hypothetical protein